GRGFLSRVGCHLITSLSTFLTPCRFPRDYGLRRKWEAAQRREGFAANDEWVLCSDHFKPDEFDRAGQVCQLRPGVIPSVLNFPAHLGRVRLLVVKISC
uniref:THAP-type domain-containing protein n=1 Tax=Amphiprion percula TaxID=161767 RepID=A0A3P8U5C2_AMPPE